MIALLLGIITVVVMMMYHDVYMMLKRIRDELREIREDEDERSD